MREDPPSRVLFRFLFLEQLKVLVAILIRVGEKTNGERPEDRIKDHRIAPYRVNPTGSGYEPGIASTFVGFLGNTGLVPGRCHARLEQ